MYFKRMESKFFIQMSSHVHDGAEKTFGYKKSIYLLEMMKHFCGIYYEHQIRRKSCIYRVKSV